MPTDFLRQAQGLLIRSPHVVKWKTFSLGNRHILVAPPSGPNTRLINHPFPQPINLQQSSGFFRSSSPLIHNRSRPEFGKLPFIRTHFDQPPAYSPPSILGDVNKSFKHANKCEIKSQQSED